MNVKKHPFSLIAGILLLLSMILAGCQSAATSAPETQTTSAQPITAATEQVANTPEPASPTEVVESGPQVGGTFTWAVSQEPDSLDPHKTGTAVSGTVLSFIGATLVYLNPDGSLSPYLAESWDVSADGLVYTFNLRHDVKFSDGTPLTAQDYAWTLNRAINPDTASPVAGQMLMAVGSVEAVDDYTLQLNLAQPYYALLIGLATPYMQPLSQAAFEANGDEEMARNPLGVGPYKLVDFLTGERITLERNPDFAWAPKSMTDAGRETYYIQNIVFRIIQDTATIEAGLESGDIDYSRVQIQDKTKLETLDQFTFFSAYTQGAVPYISLNNAVVPFDNLLVRKAFSLAIDKDSLIQVILQGAGIPQYGPISPSTVGYWPGVEEIGYHFDLEQAKALMQEAGYTYNADGMLLTPGGEPFVLMLNTSDTDTAAKMAQVIQSQLKALGVDIEIAQMEGSMMFGKNLSGDYTISTDGYSHFDADIMFFFFHSQGMNTMHVTNPDLDLALIRSRTETDPVKRQEALNEVQRIIVENAYQIPLYSAINYFPLNNRVKGASFNDKLQQIELIGAYITE
jgi:peptide/nickel transport system substrate-binding protein